MEDAKNIVDFDVIGEEAYPRLVAITLMEYRQLVGDVARLQSELNQKTGDLYRAWAENAELKNRKETAT